MTMTSPLIKTIEKDTCVAAWLSVCQLLLTQKQNCTLNLVVAITDPIAFPNRDRIVFSYVDEFLREFDSLPVVTVANTIFPAGFYKQGGAQAIYEDFPKMYQLSKEGWGTYAGRIFAATFTRKDGVVTTRIRNIIEKLKLNARPEGSKMKASYEAEVVDSSTDEDLTIYCADSDSQRGRNQPCLAHLSFKMIDGSLFLTAVYRSQHLISKGLGNYLGLGQLLYFVAMESGLKVGHLVCHATMAEIDVKTKKPTWGITKARDLVERATDATSKPVSQSGLFSTN